MKVVFELADLSSFLKVFYPDRTLIGLWGFRRRAVVHLKTSASDYEDHDVVLPDQLTAYFLGEPEAQQVALCVLIKTKEPRIEWHISKRDASHLTKHLDKVRIVAGAIAQTN